MVGPLQGHVYLFSIIFKQNCIKLMQFGWSMLTSRQLRAARALVGRSARELAERAGVHISTIQRMERGDGSVGGTVIIHEKVIRALEASGIEFLNDDGHQGVVLNGPVHGLE